MTYEPQAAVLVPALLGVGVLFTVLHNAVQGARARRRYNRRSHIEGRASGALAVSGPRAATEEGSGLRSRATYLLLGAASLGFGIYLAIGAWANFFGATWWSENIAWIAVLLQAMSLAFGVTGVYLLVIGVRYERPPAWTRPVVARSNIGRNPTDGRGSRRWHRPAEAERLRLLGTGHITDRLAFAARLTAVVWSLVAMSLFTFLALRGRIPQSEQGTSIESALAVPLQVGLLVVIAVGLVVAWRAEAVGAAIMAVAGSALAVIAGIQYPPGVAVAVSAMFLAPAFLHWLAWQRDRGVVHIGVLFAVTSVLVSSVWLGSDRLYSKYFGPAHPESDLVALPASQVQWIWAGGTTDITTTVVAKLAEPAAASGQVEVLIARDPDFTSARSSGPVTPVAADPMVVRATFTGLRPDSAYHYAVVVAGRRDDVRTGSLRTLPRGPAGFTVAFGSCARTGSNGAVFDTIREMEPLLYLQLGDFHYANIDTDDQDLFRAAMDESLTAASQSALYRSTSVGYLWDDHDFSGNDANKDAASAPAAEAVYRQYVPHYELAGTADGGPIYQAVTVGRVRFLLTDTRSTRTPQSVPDGPDKFLLGPQQERWLLAEFESAAQRDGVVVWVNSDPWIDPALAGADSWAGYATQRQRLADAVARLGLTDRLVMLSGDAHMVALDDGSNSDYSTAGSGGFPVFHAAALDRIGGTKGGPYSGGTFPGAGQFGTLAVRDDGGRTIRVRFEGRTWDGRKLVAGNFALRAEPTRDPQQPTLP